MDLRNFIHQKSYERIEFQIRKHTVTFIPALLFFLILMVVPVAVRMLLISVWTDMAISSQFNATLLLFSSMYYLSIGLFFFTYFVTFYLDLLIITNDRLLHIEQHGLFSRTIAELDLCNVQDVTSEVHGFFASLFNYGTLHIQTAGAVDKFIIRQIPYPEKLRQALLTLVDEDRKYHHQTKAAA